MSPPGKKRGYTSVPLSFARKMVIASISGNKKNAIHCVTEIDVTEPRKRIREYLDESGVRISFTAYLVRCLARSLEDHPGLNSFIRGRKLVLLDDLTISVLVERDLGKEMAPEPVGIREAQNKKLRQIHNEIREAQKMEGDQLGNLSGSTWIRLIPAFLLKTFIMVADRNISLAKKYGKVAVTAVGMFSKSATWFIPHGTATVLLTVGGISKKTIETGEGFVSKEYLNITASFDHEIVDGAPAARFMKQFSELVESGNLLIPEELN